jgi:hypothetical protein
VEEEKINQLKKKMENDDVARNELHDLMYSAAKRSNGELWKGMKRYLYQNERDNESIREELDDVKTLLKAVINNGN